MILTVCAAPSNGQVVRGTVRDQSTNLPLRGAFVVLADLEGKGRVGALSDAEGSFALRARGPGRYQLTAQLIGYAVSAALVVTITTDETHSVDLTLSVSALRLSEISVRGERRCGVRSQSAQTARLWEDAKKALNVAAWMEQDTLVWFRVRGFEQRLSSALNPLSDEVMSFDLLHGRYAFDTAPVDSLILAGFVQTNGDQQAFFGPDAAVLTSDAFLEHHCFWVERQRDRPGLVGLAFEPLRGRRVSDIRGELWLDERSGALRFVEYGFVNLGFSADRRIAGGRTEYLQLPNGAWIVSRWEIRMPDAGLSARAGRHAGTVSRVGGEILDVRIPGNESLVLVPSFTLRGTVYDSMRSAPLARARVYLPGTPLESYANNAGEFRIDSVPRGTYYVSFDHVRLDSIPAKAPLVRVTAYSGTARVQLATPDPLRLRSSLCDPEHMVKIAILQTRGVEALGAVRVIVREDETGAPLKGARVSVDWQENIPVFSMAGPRRLEATSDDKGEATLCGIPVDHEFQIIVDYLGQHTRGRPARLPAEGILQVPVRIRIPQ